MPPPQRPNLRTTPVFVDRLEQADTLRTMVLAHRRRLDADAIDGRSNQHVSVFYGPGGTGKTELSRSLQRWLRNDVTGLEHWGAAPSDAVDAIGRWELHDSQGGLDAYDLLLELRRTVGTIEPRWDAFDLAFTALAHGLRRPQNVELTRAQGGDSGWSLADVVTGALDDLANVADVAGSGLGGVGIGLIGGVLSRHRQSRRSRRLLREWEQEELADLVEQCQVMSGSEDEVRNLAARIAWLLTAEISRMPAVDRPLVVMFVDHLERLEVGRRSGEALLHALALNLPHVLFVMSGRNPLEWADRRRTDLPSLGPGAWPGLATSPDAPTGHQHFVDNLTTADAVDLLHARLEQLDVEVTPGLVEELASQSAGWPLHLDAIASLAAGRADRARPLSLDDLGGPLPAVVNRLFEDLLPEEKDVLQAACLLPYFDLRIATIAAGQSVGAVRRFVRRSIVRHNPGSTYPHRIHDEIRRIVRDTGSDAESGWSAEDWQQRALLAMQEAQDRFEQAMDAEDDQAAIHALALAISLGAENATFAPWLISGLRRVPSLIALSPLVPSAVPLEQHEEMSRVLAYVRASGHPISEAKLTALEEVEAAGGEIASTAALWSMYTLRTLGRWDDAVLRGRQLLAIYHDRPDLYRYQLGVTYRMARRFRELQGLLPELAPDRRAYMEAYVAWRHGRPEGVPERLAERLERVGSRRFEIELLGNWLTALHHEGKATLDDADRVIDIATRAGHHQAMRFALAVKGQLCLFDEEVVESCLFEARLAERARGERCPEVAALLALRGWATGRQQDIAAAQDHCAAATPRDSEWIGVEHLLDHLGHTAPHAIDGQFLQDPAIVRARWVGIYTGVLERAGGIPTGT